MKMKNKIIAATAITAYSAFGYWFGGFTDRLAIKLDLSTIDHLFVVLVGAALVFRGGREIGKKLPI